MRKKGLELLLTGGIIGFLLSGFGLHLIRISVSTQTLLSSMIIILGTLMAGIGAGITLLMIILAMEAV